jgi:hypothetical protein
MYDVPADMLPVFAAFIVADHIISGISVKIGAVFAGILLL